MPPAIQLGRSQIEMALELLSNEELGKVIRAVVEGFEHGYMETHPYFFKKRGMGKTEIVLYEKLLAYALEKLYAYRKRIF